MNRIEKYLNLAKREALKSVNDFRFGAILVVGKGIVSRGYNSFGKTHPLQNRMYPERYGTGLHAEIATLGNLRPYDTSGGELFVYRLRKDGSTGPAKPCNECEKILKTMDISRVFYSVGEINKKLIYCHFYL